MSQRRLNAVALCHVHKDILDQIDVKEIVETFIVNSDRRKTTFGKAE
jgi:hypothetical protein